MKLKFIEDNGEIITKMINDGNESEFNYIEFIELLYKGEEIQELIYDGMFTDISKKKLHEMTERLNNIVINSINEVASSNEE